MVPEVFEMSPGRNKFMINAEMIGKASKFVNKNDFLLVDSLYFDTRGSAPVGLVEIPNKLHDGLFGC